MLLLLFMLRSKFDDLDDRKIIKSVLRISVATVLSGFVLQKAKEIVSGFVNMDTFWGVFSQTAASTLIALAVFIAVCEIIKLPEYLRFKHSLSKRLFRTKQVIAEDTGEVSGI